MPKVAIPKQGITEVVVVSPDLHSITQPNLCRQTNPISNKISAYSATSGFFWLFTKWLASIC
ncbi:hypothetical protein VFPPC_17756 [Pochonia chlamydosporia 170]|uniref:Uncharacterized protein n=1 Tax=Pochonia chlamydosporia 170 TaxID=1380566 RepID=A0A219AQK5_METCM|nr:hypothetical protein VFPPC_17756 [Pochonia chlamydosporia 170]OWT43068.1 hypothetical protein VFPPC_17756 [Pochonia chlamydosporia 170]